MMALVPVFGASGCKFLVLCTSVQELGFHIRKAEVILVRGKGGGAGLIFLVAAG